MREICPTRSHTNYLPWLALFLLATANAAEPTSDPLAALAPIAASKGALELGPTALTIAHALDPSIDISVYSKRLDALAAELKPAIAAAPNAQTKLDAMADYIYKRWGFADRKSLPADVFVSFADLLDRRQWNCFGMSVLYIALGERVGLALEMVSGRGHALVHCTGTPYYIETTERGRVYENIEYLAEYLPFPCFDPSEYNPVDAREAVAVLLTQTGGAILAQGKSDLARSCFQHALEFDPNHAEARAALGFLYAQIGPIDRAIESFQAAIKADPKLREAYGGLGSALHAKGDLQGAANALRKVVELCDTQPEPLFNLGQVLYDSGDLAGSIKAFRKYTVLAPRDPDGFVRLAFPLEDAGKLDEALAAYGEALRLVPNHPDALVNSGAILEKQEKWDAAQAMYAKCLEASPTNALAYAGMGRVLSALNRPEDAVRAFARSVELDPTNPATWIDFAKLDRKSGKVESAIDKLGRALRLDPAVPETHIELALAYQERGDTPKAIEHAQTAVKLGGTLPDALKGLVAGTDAADKVRP